MHSVCTGGDGIETYYSVDRRGRGNAFDVVRQSRSGEARHGWARQAVAGVLARHEMPVYSVGGAFVRGRHTKAPQSRFVRWTDEEKAVVRTATSRADAQRLYRDAFPDSKRGPGAAARMWYTLRGTT